MDFQCFWNRKVFEFPMILDDFQKDYDFKNKRFPNPVQKVFGNPMLLRQKTSLGVTGF